MEFAFLGFEQDVVVLKVCWSLLEVGLVFFQGVGGDENVIEFSSTEGVKVLLEPGTETVLESSLARFHFRPGTMWPRYDTRFPSRPPQVSLAS